MSFMYLALAIISELIGSTALKMSQGFTKPQPSIMVVVGFGAAFYFLSQALLTVPLSLAYGIWSGVGTAATVLIGVFLFRESFNFTKALGIGAIIFGVVLLNLKVDN